MLLIDLFIHARNIGRKIRDERTIKLLCARRFPLRVALLLMLIILFGCSEQQNIDIQAIKEAKDAWNVKIGAQLQASTDYSDLEVWLNAHAMKNDMQKNFGGDSNSAELERLKSKIVPNCYTSLFLRFAVNDSSQVASHKISATQVCRYK